METVNPHRRIAAAVVAALVAALLAALLGSALNAPAGEAANRKQHKAAVKRVAIRDFAYKPRALTVRRRTKVVFVNRDSAPHTATRRGKFDTGVLRRGQSKAIRFRRRGVYRYICTIHPSMRGKIVVR